jgi:glucokinase
MPDFMQQKKFFIGLDIGGTGLKARAFTQEGQVLAEESGLTLDDGTGKWLENAKGMVKTMLGHCPGEARVGIAAPGLPSADGRTIVSMPGRLKGLEGLNWQEWLKLPDPVPVFNDAQAALLGEVWLGAARGAAHVVLLTLGTGVGGAALVDGRVLRGRLGRAGHLGHVSLNPNGAPDVTNMPGSLEDAIGEHNLTERSSGRFRSTNELVTAYRAGSPEAAAVWLNSLRALAAAIAGFINVLDPEVVIIGGGIADADDALFVPLEEMIDKFEWRPTGNRVRIAKASLGKNAGATGAAYGAMMGPDSNPVEPSPSK